MQGMVGQKAVAEAGGSSLVGQKSPCSDEQRICYAWVWLLWSGRRFVLRMTAAGLLAGLVLAFAVPARYTAKTQLMPPDTNDIGIAAAVAGSVADKAGGLGTAAADLLGFKSSGAIFVGILKSRTVQERLVDRFDLRRVYRKKYWSDACEKLADRTEIVEDRKSGIISISVTDHDRDRAQQLAKGYVEELNHVVASSAMSAAGREREFIEHQMADVRKEMDDSSQALADFSTKNGTIDIKEQTRALVDAAATVQSELIVAQAELKGLKAIYTDSNVRVRSVGARIEELNRQLRELGGGTASQQRSVEDYPRMRELPQLGITFEQLYRRNKIADAVYEALAQQYELSKLQEAKDTPTVQVLDLPERPELRCFPPRALILFGCMVLSIGFAAAWLIAGDAWQSTSNEHPAKHLAIEICGTMKSHPFWRSKYVLRLRSAFSHTSAVFVRRQRVSEDN